jgi:hypothetical protein
MFGSLGFAVRDKRRFCGQGCSIRALRRVSSRTVNYVNRSHGFEVCHLLCELSFKQNLFVTIHSSLSKTESFEVDNPSKIFI